MKSFAMLNGVLKTFPREGESSFYFAMQKQLYVIISNSMPSLRKQSDVYMFM